MTSFHGPAIPGKTLRSQEVSWVEFLVVMAIPHIPIIHRKTQRLYVSRIGSSGFKPKMWGMMISPWIHHFQSVNPRIRSTPVKLKRPFSEANHKNVTFSGTVKGPHNMLYVYHSISISPFIGCSFLVIVIVISIYIHKHHSYSIIPRKSPVF